MEENKAISALAPDYRVQDGCHNCVLAFVFVEYDSGDTFYCTLNAPPRPKCGSSCLNEHFSQQYDREAYEKGWAAWDEWTKGREVNHSGICPGWAIRPQQ